MEQVILLIVAFILSIPFGRMLKSIPNLWTAIVVALLAFEIVGTVIYFVMRSMGL